MKRLGLKLGGMNGTACASAVEQAIIDVPGVVDLSVNFDLERATIAYNGQQTNSKQIVRAVVEAGYQATPIYPAASSKFTLKRRDLLPDIEIKLSISIVTSLCLIIGFIPQLLNQKIGWIPNEFHTPIGQFILTIPVHCWCGQSLLINGYRGIRAGQLNLSGLASLGVVTTYLYSLFITFYPQLINPPHPPFQVYYLVTTIAIALILWSEQLGQRDRLQVAKTMGQLKDPQPQSARIIESGTTQIIPIAAVSKSQIISVHPGEIIPTDGTIIAGVSVVNEMMATGANLPLTRQIGDRVISTTLNYTGLLNIRVSHINKETFLAQIEQLVKKFRAAKVPIRYRVDRVARYLIPIIILLAISTGLWWFQTTDKLSFALIASVGVMIIAYPPGLGLAATTAIGSGTSRCTKRGILIKNSLGLELLHRAQTIVFDKTGTLTYGKPSVTNFIPIVDNYHGNELDILQLVASIENLSVHPLATAIVDYAIDRQVQILAVTQFQEIVGSGLQGIVEVIDRQQRERKLVQIGSSEWIATLGIDTVIQATNQHILTNYQQEWQTAGKKVAWVAIDGEIAGIMAIGDVLKPTALATVRKLQKLGMEVILLTGDRLDLAQQLAQQLGIDRVFASVNPQEKAEIIRTLQSPSRQQQCAIIAMVGDGLNDAPALAQADVGIAISTGAAPAISASDLTIVSPDLRAIIMAIEISRKTSRQLSQNLWLACVYHLMAIPIAAGLFYPRFGLSIDPLLVLAVVALSSGSVVLNNLRLRKY